MVETVVNNITNSSLFPSQFLNPQLTEDFPPSPYSMLNVRETGQKVWQSNNIEMGEGGGNVIMSKPDKFSIFGTVSQLLLQLVVRESCLLNVL